MTMKTHWFKTYGMKYHLHLLPDLFISLWVGQLNGTWYNKIPPKIRETWWPASWETCMQVRKQQLELGMEQQTGSI